MSSMSSYSVQSLVSNEVNQPGTVHKANEAAKSENWGGNNQAFPAVKPRKHIQLRMIREYETCVVNVIKW